MQLLPALHPVIFYYAFCNINSFLKESSYAVPAINHSISL